MPKVFVDTNIWAYAVDGNAGVKRSAARQALGRLGPDAGGVISTQVMQEFYVTATRKLGIAPGQARQLLEDISLNEVVVVDPDLVMKASVLSERYDLSFWDALIVAAADKAKCRELWTEDMNPGHVIAGMRIVNPLARP